MITAAIWCGWTAIAILETTCAMSFRWPPFGIRRFAISAATTAAACLFTIAVNQS